MRLSKKQAKDIIDKLLTDRMVSLAAYDLGIVSNSSYIGVKGVRVDTFTLEDVFKALEVEGE